MSTPHYPFCTTCQQDLIRDCHEALSATNDNPCAVARAAFFRRILNVAVRAGLSEQDVSRLLGSGYSIRDILEIIESRASKTQVA